MPSMLVCEPMAKKKSKDGRGGPRAGSGRKPVDDPFLSRSLAVRATQWERWRAAADAAGLSLSEWIRHVCDSAASASD